MTTQGVAAGLTAAEVAERVAQGRSNAAPVRAGRTTWGIVRANVFTRINAILGVLLVLVLSTGSIINGAFGLLIIANSGIGIIQEIRAKRTLDRLTIVGQTRPIVRRDSVAAPIAPESVVQDDIIEVGPGDQIVVDGEVVESSALDIDESLLTGEADAVDKPVGAQIMSGSFVVSGSGAYRATKVGANSYAAGLAAEASTFTLVGSELRSGIDRILRIITLLLLPAGALTIVNQLVISGSSFSAAILGMVAALVPMVPEGLVLMTSIAFAVGVIRLGRRQCLVNELPAIEGLARVDVVCADKTGTLTEAGMRLSEVTPVGSLTRDEIDAGLAALAAADPRPNASVQAIGEAFDTAPGWTTTAVEPFSSARKWSGVSFGEHGNWLLGAPDVLTDPDSEVGARATALGSDGLRVLLLARSGQPVDTALPEGQLVPADVAACALVCLEQKVRPDAARTIEYFAEQRVAVKVISGDNAVSVGAVAASLGLGTTESAVDGRSLPAEGPALADALEHGTVFGRIRPEQKRAMVQALKSRGHTVAMTGDGVNDVLALKDADIGVAMGSGSSASRAVAQIVLLDNKFATLPYVVGEGRRVIGNIERVSNLFLTKTVYAVLLALLVGLGGIGSKVFGWTPISYPFQPIHVTIAAWFTIGIPAFLLSLAPNNERAQTGFVSRVLRLAVPSGVIIALCTFAAYLLAGAGNGDPTRVATTSLMTMIGISTWVLAVVARPYAPWKIALLVISVLAYVGIFLLPLTQRLFFLDPSDLRLTTISLVLVVIGSALVETVWQVRRLRARAESAEQRQHD